MDEPEFVWFKQYPPMVKRIIAENRKEPRAALRRAKENINNIEVDPEFEWCRGMARTMRQLASSKNCLERLRNAKSEHDTISQESEFSWCKSGLLRNVVLQNSNPRIFLRFISQTADNILKEPEFSQFKNRPSLVRQTIANNPGTARELLRTGKRHLEDISSEEEFAWCRKSSTLQEAAVFGHPKDPKDFLRKAKLSWETINSDPEFEWCRGMQNVLMRLLKSRKILEILRLAKRNFNEIRAESEFEKRTDAEIKKAVLLYKNARSQLRSDKTGPL